MKLFLAFRSAFLDHKNDPFFSNSPPPSFLSSLLSALQNFHHYL